MYSENKVTKKSKLIFGNGLPQMNLTNKMSKFEKINGYDKIL